MELSSVRVNIIFAVVTYMISQQHYVIIYILSEYNSNTRFLNAVQLRTFYCAFCTIQAATDVANLAKINSERRGMPRDLGSGIFTNVATPSK